MAYLLRFCNGGIYKVQGYHQERDASCDGASQRSLLSRLLQNEVFPCEEVPLGRQNSPSKDLGKGATVEVQRPVCHKEQNSATDVGWRDTGKLATWEACNVMKCDKWQALIERASWKLYFRWAVITETWNPSSTIQSAQSQCNPIRQKPTSHNPDYLNFNLRSQYVEQCS